MFFILWFSNVRNNRSVHDRHEIQVFIFSFDQNLHYISTVCYIDKHWNKTQEKTEEKHSERERRKETKSCQNWNTDWLGDPNSWLDKMFWFDERKCELNFEFFQLLCSFILTNILNKIFLTAIASKKRKSWNQIKVIAQFGFSLHRTR